MQRAAICAGLAAVALKQSPRSIVGDTKLGIAVNPAAYLKGALHLWDPSTDFGVAQNQGYGYLFPMGPFFLVGKAVGLSPWLVQRLWWATLLCVAFFGVVKLAEQLRIGTPSSQLLSGLAFALSPRILSTLGPISVESLPYCLAPWVIVPLVRGSQSGSPRRAAGMSALAVFGMGAVNAAAVLAALPPAALFLLTREKGRRRRSLMAWWVGCLALATMWWVIPLLLLAKFSAPFLDHIESASTTTSVTSLVEVLRGTSDWVAFVAGPDGPTWPAGFALLTNRLVITYTVVVLIAGVWGLLHRDLVERSWLLVCLLLGVAGLTFGHIGPLAGPLAGTERDLLDGALAPFRNVHKFDVNLRLPLALGIAHLLPSLWCASSEGGETTRRRGVLWGAAGALLAVALPVITAGLAPRHPFTEIPGYWQQAASWLNERPDSRTLVLPGSSAVDYLWGSPNDEPLQPLATSPWAVRSAVPLTPSSTIRALDSIEVRLAAGYPSAGLAAALARTGVHYLLVRNDLDYGVTGSTRPLLVHEALVGSPGIIRVATFGGAVGGGVFGRYADQGLEVPYPALEMFEVVPSPHLAELHDLSDVVRVTGGAESLLSLEDRGLLQGRPVLLDSAGSFLPAPGILTDSLRKREVFFGRQQDNASATLTAAESFRRDVPAHDYLPPGSAAHLAVARYIGVSDVTASSSASDANAFGGANPSRSPFAAIDADPLTSWRSDIGAGRNPWWRLDLGGRRSLAGLHLQLDTAAPGGPVRTVRVIGDSGSALVNVARDGAADVPALGLTSHLEVQAEGAAGFGLSEVSLPGLSVTRTIDTDVAEQAQVITLDAAPGQRHACFSLVGLWLCNNRLAREGEDYGGLDRTVHPTTGGTYVLSQVFAVPRPGATLDALLARGRAVQVTASSSAVDDPRGDALAAVDGLPGTGWRAQPGDQDPSLTLTFDAPRRLSTVQLLVARGSPVSRPRLARIESAQGTRNVVLDASGRAAFPELITSSVRVHLLDPVLVATVDPFTKTTDFLPTGVSELRLTGLTPLVMEHHVTIPCGQGPDITVDSTVVHTKVETTTSALADRSNVELLPCGAPTVTVSNGSRITTRSTSLLQPISMTLTARALRSPVPATPVVGTHWSATARDLALPSRVGATLLSVHENANPGWIATLNGAELQSVELDGWQQGWVVPAGVAGEVHLRFVPDRIYRRGLLLGAALVLVLLVVALAPVRAPGAPAVGRRSTSPVLVGLTGLLVVAVGGLTGLAAVGAALLLWLLGGWWRSWLALVALAAAGGLLVLNPWTTTDYAGARAPAQALCVIGLAMIWSTLLADVRRTRFFSRSAGRSSTT